jgi:DNA modification methylase
MSDVDPSSPLQGSTFEPAHSADAVSQAAPLVDVQLGSLKLPVNYLPITSLVPNPRNARTHSKKQINKVAASLRKFGFVSPAIIDEKNIILVGHCRIESAKLLGFTEVPTIRVSHLNSAQKRAFALADNRLAEDASWDFEILAVELKELSEINLDVVVESTGFESAEIDRIIEQDEVARAATQEFLPEVDNKNPSVSLIGDLWILGQHRLLCGDATAVNSYERLMGDDRAQMVFGDLPYNLAIKKIGGMGKIHHGEFPMASGEMSAAEFTAFLRSVFKLLTQFSLDGSIHYLCMDFRHDLELRHAADGLYAEYKNLCVWNKTNAGMGSFYRSKHELVFVFKNGAAPHINNFGLGGDGRYRTNVWDYPGVNIRRPGGHSDLLMHPTAKPVAMVMDAIKDCSKRNGIILDPFSGSGTTIIAAQRTKRIARAMELDAAYVDLAIRRWEALTGEKPRQAETGLTLDEVAIQRGVPAPHYAFEQR